LSAASEDAFIAFSTFNWVFVLWMISSLSSSFVRSFNDGCGVSRLSPEAFFNSYVIFAFASGIIHAVFAFSGVPFE
jgi:hypothetical protein